ncbi:lymphokine-activated killer T-cell-originated protein kinase [Nilaparvata lugens]|uniref:lymphokine-activated killer T-cell-originated protein kinase n=1 Tax=Nilaparvata lugens TaxID=108931 RepID=UPI00193E3D29|nr:lymphokine-activated killer T-cell-originated protein kinase [Nilaparvata lugens]
METPMRASKKDFHVPETPAMKQVGYGTGVGVYQLNRSPNPAGLRSPWALKKVLKSHKHSTFGKLLTDEAKILQKLNHPNIIGFRGFKVLDDGRTALAMEKCSECLGDMIEQRYEAKLGPYPAENIYKVVRDISSALVYLHEEVQLLHGDIKSFNILVNGDFETVKLCDFGMSLRLDANSGRALGEYCGTNCWSAPEALAEDDVTAAADIWALGLTVWEMLSLSPPHIGTICSQDENASFNLDESSFVNEGDYGTRPPLPDHKFGPEYEKIILLFEQCTETEPKNRPTAKEILEFLETQ